MTSYRQNFTPERAQAGTYMAAVALALWLIVLPLSVLITSQ
jgi:hypothetical protein